MLRKMNGDTVSYKPKYKNLRDAYEEFKALKQGGRSTGDFGSRGHSSNMQKSLPQ